MLMRALLQSAQASRNFDLGTEVRSEKLAQCQGRPVGCEVQGHGGLSNKGLGYRVKRADSQVGALRKKGVRVALMILTIR